MKPSTPTKLTLRLDEGLIHRAKRYASEQDRSLSQLVADYFARLAAPPRVEGKAGAKSPITARLRGALRHGAGTKSLLSRADHRAHLEDKHR
jgi:Family of unknown function (DUF6364)